MSIAQTYCIMLNQVKEIVEKTHVARVRNIAWLICGMFHSRSVHLTKIASKIPGKAKKLSRADRLRTFLNNRHVQVRRWYRPMAEALIQAAIKSGQPVRLLVDGSKVGSAHQLLIVALAYRRRAIPIAWTWVRSARGHSSARKQQALLSYVKTLMPAETEVIVIGDSEFAPLQPLLEAWNWFYALRQKGSHLLCQSQSDEWQRCDTLVKHPGDRCWLPAIQLTYTHRYACNFLALWRTGEELPWLLATNLPSARLAQLHYSRRMWIEEMFADFKGHGFDLEASRLKHFLRLSRLTLAVAILYVTLLAFGSQTIKNGQRHLVDRKDRRDLSIFRIGVDMFERLLTNQKFCSIRSVPYF